jgi:small subunit ribosomal protein S5
VRARDTTPTTMNRLTKELISCSRLLVKSSQFHRSHAHCVLFRAYSSETSSPDALPTQTPTSDAPASTPVNQGTLLTSRRRKKRRTRAPSQIVNDLPFPDISEPNPLLDLADRREFPPSKLSPFASRVVVRNDPSLFTPGATDVNDGDGNEMAKQEGSEEEGWEEEQEEEGFPEREDGEDEHGPVLPLSRGELEKLHRFPLITRGVTQQTGKGKIHRRGVLVVVGNGNGLVGYGEAKHDDGARATNRAFAMAVRNMDYVDRFESRTIWTEMSSKLGATRIILRPRPVGFGLHCNPNIHQVLKAAGIKDISAKVWGSRNPLNVIKLLFRMLHAGNAPLAMGNGIGGPGRKLDKGSGVRGKQEIERERGRKLLNLRTR